MKILILTGHFGMGHYSAAISLKQEIEGQQTKANVKIVDIIDYITPKLQFLIYSSFDFLVKKVSRLYNLVYRSTTNSDFDAITLLMNLFIGKIQTLVDENNPDIIISTLPFCSRIVSEYKTKMNHQIPLVTCITDISIHNEWISDQTDLYLVPTDTVKKHLIKNGIERKSIIISGIPVKESFKKLSINKNRCEKETKNLLIMGGGLGLIPFDDDFYKTLSQENHLKVTVITGKNKKAYHKLFGKYDNIQVVGYTDQVYQYMEEADLIISKAGGITLFETIYAQLPLLVPYPFLEQEKNNAYFIEKQGLGQIIWNDSENITQIALDMLQDEKKLSAIQNNMKQMRDTLNSNVVLDIVSRFIKDKVVA